MIAMIQLEKSNEKFFKFTEKSKKSDGRKPTETFTRRNLKSATNRKFSPSISKSRLQERKIKRDTYIPPEPNTIRQVSKNVNQLRKLCPLLRQV